MNRPTHFPTLWSGRLQRSLVVSGITLTSLLGITAGTLQAQTPDSADSASPALTTPAASDVAPVEAAPVAPVAPAPPAAAPLNDPYIDSTDYSIGATERTVPRPAVSSVGLGRGLPSAPPSISVGAIAPPGYDSIAIGTTPSLKDFYRRTLRPPGQLGNGNVRLIFPLSIPAPITSLFGWRVHPIFGTPRFHSGTDIGAPMGTPVLAAYAGQVVMADFLGGYGLAVALNHNHGKQQTLYGHLSEVFVKAGDTVQQGAVIGRVGDTGNSTGPHLHFEYRELTSDGWVAMDAGAQLEYALAQLVQMMDVAQKGISAATGLQVSQKTQVGVSGEIAWNPATDAVSNPNLSPTVDSAIAPERPTQPAKP